MSVETERRVHSKNLKLPHRMIMVKIMVKYLKYIISGTCMHVHQDASTGASTYIHTHTHTHT